MNHEITDQSISIQNRDEGREEIPPQDHPGTASEDASWPWKIALSKGAFALVDEEDFDILSRYKWHLLCGRYASRHIIVATGKQVTVLMHRIIIGAPAGMHTDHRDGNGLNNRRYNFRLATRSQNLQNSKLHRDSKSGLKGAWFHTSKKKWAATIVRSGKLKFLGYFSTAEDAHAAYCAASVKLHGEFSRTA